jgi:hypothetical protein
MDPIIILLIICCCCCCIISSSGGFYYNTTQNSVKTIKNSTPTSNSDISTYNSDISTSNSDIPTPILNDNTFIQSTTTQLPITLPPITTPPITTPPPTTLPPLYIFTSHTFTNADATGRFGPTLAAVRNTYSSEMWTSSYLNMTNDNGIQLWTVPKTGSYTITIAGAAGAHHLPNYTSMNFVGLGCKFNFTENLTKGDVYGIVVGQRATPKTNGNDSNGGGGGGGGSFIFNNTSKFLLAAAGGGGGRSIINVDGTNTIEETYGLNGVSKTQATLFNYNANKTIYDSFYKANDGKNGGHWISNSPEGYNRNGGKGWFEMIETNNFSGYDRNSFGSYGGFGGGNTTADHNGGGAGGYSGGGSVNYAIFPDLARSGGGGGSSYSKSEMSKITINDTPNGFVTITLN